MARVNATNVVSQYHHFKILFREDGKPWELGRGTTGVTYKARDLNLNLEVALKVVSAFEDARARKRFLAEAQAAASIRHPHIASIFHFGEQNQECFYAMELLKGGTLDELLQKIGKIHTKQALEITLQVARALSALERQKIVHGGIEPANLMLVGDSDEHLVVKIIDFGLANYNAATNVSSNLQGKPHFASPEQIRGELLDVRSDIYSLGATLYLMLTGHLPFPTSPSSIPLEVFSPEIRNLVLRMLAKDCRKRPQTAADLRRGLEVCIEALSSSELPQIRLPALPPLPHHKQRALIGIIGAITALAVAILLIIFVFSLAEKNIPLRVHTPTAAENSVPKSSDLLQRSQLENLLADAAAAQAKDHYAAALSVYAQIANQFPLEKLPRERMEMITAFLRSNAFVITPENFLTLRPHLEAAAAHNIVSAQMLLGEQLRNTEPAQSLKWFKAAARNGQTEAMTQAGLMLASGIGISNPDMQLAVEWFKQAAAAGDSNAMTALAECFLLGKGTNKNSKRAAALLQAAAALHHVPALNLLGDLYARGEGVPQNFPEALRLFSQAAQLGSGEAMANLGVLYMRGQGVSQDAAKATSIWKTGAERGFAACMLNYAKSLEAGTGTKKNDSEARYWYLEAARAGNPEAMKWCQQRSLIP